LALLSPAKFQEAKISNQFAIKAGLYGGRVQAYADEMGVKVSVTDALRENSKIANAPGIQTR
jgi:hypothetical protein